jgi:Ca-activated chloride channel family protein
MLEFAYPWLLAIILVPPVIFWLFPAYQESRNAVNVPFMARLVRITGRQPEAGAVVLRGSFWQKLALWGGWLLLVTAIARPQWIEDPIVKVLPTRDLLLAVDLSGSMEAEDFTDQQGQRIDRLSAVKQVLDEFLSRREGDRVGLLFFGSAPFIQVPFTEDLEVCRTLLQEAEVRMAGPQTMLGDAIGLAINVFDQSETRERTLILLTDGNDTESQVPPPRAAEIARDKGITIHTVAMGDPETVGENELDEQSLQQIADITGGSYFRALDRTGLEGIYRQLDKIETHQVDTLSYSPKRDLFHWPLAGLFLIIVAFHLVKIFCAVSRPVFKLARRFGAFGLVVMVALVAIADMSAAHFSALELTGAFHFLRPTWLLALIPIMAMVAMIGLLQKAEEHSWRDVIAPHLLQHLIVGSNHNRRLRPRHLLAAVLLLTCVALAGPSWQKEPSPLTEDQAALFLAVKVTPSMQIRDLKPSRLDRAVQKISDLLALRAGTLNGLIAYAGSAHLVMPLTRDGSIISQFAAELSPEIMPAKGDAAHEAVVLAAERLTASGVRGTILLVADGIDSGELGRLAELKAQIPYPVHLLAMVRNSRTLSVEGFDRSGVESLIEKFDGSLVMATPDHQDVEQLAARTEVALAGMVDSTVGERWRDAGYWLLPLLLLLALFWFRAGWVVIYG